MWWPIRAPTLGMTQGLAFTGRRLGEVGPVLCQGRPTGSVAPTRPFPTSASLQVCWYFGIWLCILSQPGTPRQACPLSFPRPEACSLCATQLCNLLVSFTIPHRLQA